MPVAVEKIAQVINEATAKFPGSLYVATLIALNNLATIPAFSTTYPINKKRGMAINTWFSMVEKAFFTIKSNILFAKIPDSANNFGSKKA